MKKTEAQVLLKSWRCISRNLTLSNLEGATVKLYAFLTTWLFI